MVRQVNSIAHFNEKKRGEGFTSVPCRDSCSSKVEAVYLSLLLFLSTFARLPTIQESHPTFLVASFTGINAYFAYTVVGFRGTGLIGYKQALAAVFIEVRKCCLPTHKSLRYLSHNSRVILRYPGDWDTAVHGRQLSSICLALNVQKYH
eukprot:617323-Pelagomonas_calceolata.AAC.4